MKAIGKYCKIYFFQLWGYSVAHPLKAAIMISGIYSHNLSRAEQHEILEYRTRERQCITGMHHLRHSKLLSRLVKNAHALSPFPNEDAFQILRIYLISSIQSALGYFYACENQPSLMHAYATGPKSFQGYISRYS